MRSMFVRAAALAVLGAGLLMPVSALAATPSDPGTGTLVGAVTCGPDEDAPAPYIVVTANGTHLQTLTDSTGKFTLTGVPAGETFRVEAIADPQGSVTTSRFNVNVQPGETLDIGSMDLAICGQPAQPAPTPDDQPADFSQG
ncbi:MAG TPA: carboxypeptidase-like regulatory domain-containing protein [Chloroflexota bacterium]